MNHTRNLILCSLAALALLKLQVGHAEDSRTSSASLSPSSQAVTGTTGVLLTPTATYKASGFASAPTYSISPALPAGLAFNTATGVVSGTPTAVLAATTFRVKAALSTTTAYASIRLTVTSTAPVVKAALTPTSQTILATQGKAITATQPMTATGFSGSVSYTVAPSLPAGLTMAAATGIIQGTPTVAQSSSNYTITGTSGTTTATSSVAISVLQSGTSGGGSTGGTTTGLNCPDPAVAANEAPAIQGRRAYLRLNCYSCHGDYAQGGTMAPSVQGDSGSDVQDAVVNGDDGMPPFASALCANDIPNLQAYLAVVKSLQTSKTPQLLDWKTYPGNQFTTSTPAFTYH